MKKIIAVVVLLIVWTIIDFVVHNTLLAQHYEATSELWRAADEMKGGVMMLVTLLIAGVFTFGYSTLISEKSVGAGVQYGTVVGLVVALGFGFGTYGYMPISLTLATIWFVYAVISYVVGGAVVGALVKD